MNKTLFRTFLIFTLTTLLLAACQFSGPGTAAISSTALPNAATLEPTIAPTPHPTRTPRPAATATQDPLEVKAKQAISATSEYFAALESGDFELAAERLSKFSLAVFQMTRGDAVSALKNLRAAGAAWSGLKITGTQVFDPQTVLVGVQYTLAGQDAEKKATEVIRDEVWVFRQEVGEWRYNWSNLIDYRTLDVDPQTLNGLTLKPVQANRFPDRIQLVMLAQNRSSEPIVLGQVNEILGTFYFGSQAIEAEKIQKVLNPQRTVPDLTLEVKGTFTDFPDSIEVRKWKNYNVKPWFVFQLN